MPAGRNLINSLMRMNISMDKYKTSQLGQALKKVYRGEIMISDSVKMAQDEIKSVFFAEKLPGPKKTPTTDFWVILRENAPFAEKMLSARDSATAVRATKTDANFL